MFTGIIEHLGRVGELKKDGSTFLEVESPGFFASSKPGDSVAVNGTCLTVLSHDSDSARFELGPETLKKTNLSDLASGDILNLEHPLGVGGHFGGHFVQGHIDTTAKVLEMKKEGNTAFLRLELPPEYEQYLIPQGSIAVEGVSLTIAELVGSRIGIMLMDYTLEKTNLGEKKAGDKVNIECDMLAKMMKSMLAGSTLQDDVLKIKDRNARVELDKAWETSWIRRILILSLTYLVVVLFFLVMQFDQPFINPIVPTVGFFLSTLTIPYVKRWWIKNHQS